MINIKLTNPSLDGFAVVTLRQLTAREEISLNLALARALEPVDEAALLEIQIAQLARSITRIESEGDWPAGEFSPAEWLDAAGLAVITHLAGFLRPSLTGDLGK